MEIRCLPDDVQAKTRGYTFADDLFQVVQLLETFPPFTDTYMEFKKNLQHYQSATEALSDPWFTL